LSYGTAFPGGLGALRRGVYGRCVDHASGFERATRGNLAEGEYVDRRTEPFEELREWRADGHLIYRHIVTIPNGLAWAWSALRPHVEGKEIKPAGRARAARSATRPMAGTLAAHAPAAGRARGNRRHRALV